MREHTEEQVVFSCNNTLDNLNTYPIAKLYDMKSIVRIYQGRYPIGKTSTLLKKTYKALEDRIKEVKKWSN